MSALMFFGIVFVVLAVLCYADLQRTNRQNRRNWQRHLAARKQRSECDRYWEILWDEMSNTAPWKPELRGLESEAWQSCMRAQKLCDDTRKDCKGACPADLALELINL